MTLNDESRNKEQIGHVLDDIFEDYSFKKAHSDRKQNFSANFSSKDSDFRSELSSVFSELTLGADYNNADRLKIDKTGIYIDSGILDEIIFRYLINLPAIEHHPVRLSFIFEEAHWFLIDFYPKYKNMSFSNFISILLQYIIKAEKALRNKKNTSEDRKSSKSETTNLFRSATKPIKEELGHNPPGHYAKVLLDALASHVKMFWTYKHSIPVFAALIMNPEMDHVLLNQGYSKRAQFLFPRGKKSFNETGREAAIREVYEEIGLDVSNKIMDIMFTPPNEKYNILFVINQNMDVPLQPQTRNEIKDIKWFKISDVMKGGGELAAIRAVFQKIQGELKYLKEKRVRFDRKKILDCFDI